MTQDSILAVTELAVAATDDLDERMDTEMDTSLMLANIGRTLNSVGEFGQIGIVWFSIGVAIWQMLVIGRNLMTSGELVKRVVWMNINGLMQLSIVGSSPLAEILGRSLGQGKSQLVSGNTRDVIEMGFWILRFLEDFEKQYAKSNLQRSNDVTSAANQRTSNGVGKIWSSNARSYLKMMRYVTKFLSTSDNFQRKNKPRKS